MIIKKSKFIETNPYFIFICTRIKPAQELLLICPLSKQMEIDVRTPPVQVVEQEPTLIQSVQTPQGSVLQTFFFDLLNPTTLAKNTLNYYITEYSCYVMKTVFLNVLLSNNIALRTKTTTFVPFSRQREVTVRNPPPQTAEHDCVSTQLLHCRHECLMQNCFLVILALMSRFVPWQLYDKKPKNKNWKHFKLN